MKFVAEYSEEAIAMRCFFFNSRQSFAVEYNIS